MIRLLSSIVILCFYCFNGHLCPPIDYEEEYERIRGLMGAAKLVNATDQVDFLLRYHVDKIHEYRNEYERKLTAANAKVEVANKELGAVQEQKRDVQETIIRIRPRAVLYTVKERYDVDYAASMETHRRDLEEAQTVEKNCQGRIKHLQNQMQKKEIRENATQLACKMQEMSAKNETCAENLELMKSLEAVLPDSAWGLNNRNNRVLEKAHTWRWIMANRKDDDDVRRIEEYLVKFYGEKSDEERNQTSFFEYRNQFCKAMGELEEDVSNKEVHVLFRFPTRKRYEFKKLKIFGVEPLDEFTTVLINAAGRFNHY